MAGLVDECRLVNPEVEKNKQDCLRTKSGVIKQFRDAAHNLMWKIVSITSTEEDGAFDDTVFANQAKYNPKKKHDY